MNNYINEKIVHAAPVPPFVRFVASAVPMVFDNSLSYYECLCALWKWMQDNLVDVINNNATVTEHYIDLDLETRSLFNQLKTYVDTYFDNLDVQEEINNKLDQMAEDGELQQIIAEYLKTQVIYDTTLDMIADASNLVNGVRVETLGYRTVDDNGASFFVIRNTGTADGKGVIDLENGLYAHMIYKHDFVTPEMFGAYGDGVNDHNDSDAIQYAINTGKTVEFAPKTYMCYSLTVDNPAVLHGNGATLKRPELDIAPYSLTVAQMKWIKTITVSANCVLKDITFDNNCFSMWQLSDGYAQEQSASVIFNNADTKFEVSVEGCKCQYSAGDGLLITNNAKINISDYESYETFRGGITIVGNSEVNVDGWNSQSVTLPDGLDIEIDSATQTTTPPIININNVIIDDDVDISVANNGIVTISNLVMREFSPSKYGFRSTNLGGTLIFNNCLLRRGTGVSTSCYFAQDGSTILFNNCKIIAPYENTDTVFYVTENTNYNGYRLEIRNCDIVGYSVIHCGTFNGDIILQDNNIKCVIVNKGVGAAYLQASNFIISGNQIELTGSDSVDAFQFCNNQYAPGDGTSYYALLNNVIRGNTAAQIYMVGWPKVMFDSTAFRAGYIMRKANGATPKFYGKNRVIVVPTSTDLTFPGFVAGEDIAITLDTGTRYQYTSGTTWTAI